MAFALADFWVWDFWLADDGARFHLFFLHAPKSLGDANLRHRNAQIGHATSNDLRRWDYHGVALGPGAAGDFDETATWTGSVVRGPDAVWRMFYTGTRFLRPDAFPNVETIGVATSTDLFSWTKAPGPILRADARWYETLGSSSWPEEAWRDPWVFSDELGRRWHMLITARSNHGPDLGRGVIGYATSEDLQTWTAGPPLSAPQAGFAHLEVPQLIEMDGRHILLFCCNAARLTNDRTGSIGGIWAAPALGPTGPFDTARAKLLLPERYYAGRAVRDRRGDWMLMAFDAEADDGTFPGTITDPMSLRLDADGLPSVISPMRAAS
jgi:beta-fructofuranosidase